MLLLLTSNAYAGEGAGADNATNQKEPIEPCNTPLSKAPAVPALGTPAPPRLSGFGNSKDAHQDHAYRASQMAFIGSVAFDLGTTMRMKKGWTEGNPLLGKSKAQQLSRAVRARLFCWGVLQ